MQDPNLFPGELVIMGFAGTSIPDSALSALARERISHFILFAQNYESKEQLLELTGRIQSTVTATTHLPAMISVDQEGGRVQRFRNGFTLLPTARKVGEKGSPQLAYELSRIQAKELYAAGLQLNFAPICDIHTNPANPVIGDRAYGSTAEEVSRMASAVVRGHLTEGVEACIKHFPGHGDTHVDSHESLPRVDTPIEMLRSREWVPFLRAIRSGARYLMSAHILLPHLDETRPGTLSPTFLKNHLRGELNYSGVVVSDDMEMGAITENFGAEEAPILALQAGCDLLCYRSEQQALAAIESIRRALEDRVLDSDAIRASIERTRKIRAEIKLAENTMTRQERLDRIGHPDHGQFIAKNF